MKSAIRLAPVYASWWVELLAIAYRDHGQFGQAISAAKEALRLNPASREETEKLEPIGDQ